MDKILLPAPLAPTVMLGQSLAQPRTSVNWGGSESYTCWYCRGGRGGGGADKGGVVKLGENSIDK